MTKDKLVSTQSDRERQVISLFIRNLHSSRPDLKFETDARVFKFGCESLLFSTDEFSAEDNFRDHDPFVLGWNVAVATISDILAAGGVPLFYGHTATICSRWNDSYIHKFSKGIDQCLRDAQADFLGGDIGIADSWAYTGIVIGRLLTPLNRKGAKEGDLIYMTGEAGKGNLEAALKLYSGKRALEPLLNSINAQLSLRIKESALVRKYARCCIDSSDGVLRALLDISRINKKGFIIDNIPFCREGVIACKLIGKPEELLFMGECGEYELVFTVSGEIEDAFISEAKFNKLSFNKIGRITTNEQMLLHKDTKVLDFAGYDLFARNFRDIKEYIDRLVQFMENGR